MTWPTEPLRPFETSFEGCAPAGEWANTVRISTVEVFFAEHAAGTEEDKDFLAADSGGTRHLVQVDTNYKDTRPGEHPVDLGRTEAVQFAASVLAAVEDTFHYARVGELRAAEAAELLRALDEVEYALTSLRGHALDDLLRRVGLETPAAEAMPSEGQEAGR